MLWRSLARAILAACLLALPACNVNVYKAPPWTDGVARRLRCGMTPEDVQKLTPIPLRLEQSPPEYPWAGSSVLSKGITELRLGFEDGRLHSYTMVRSGPISDAITTHPSPLHDLCSGKLVFHLTIFVPKEALGSTLLLNGRTVAKLEDAGKFSLELPEGEHLVSIVRDGAPLFSKSFQNVLQSSGNLRWDPMRPDLFRD